MAEGDGSADGGGGGWAFEAQDLDAEPALRGCPRIEFEGRTCPALGGIPLLAQIGKGGMGFVYYGVHPRLDEGVAVKVLPPDPLRAGSLRERFLREARIAARLRSPHLVQVLDADRDPATDAHYIVMEFVTGPSAAQWMRETRIAGASVTEDDALTVCLALTEGLGVAHAAGVVHRDVKPANVLLPRGVGERPDLAAAKLADLGLARPLETDQELTIGEGGLGTAGFMAPEQARSARNVGRQADVFSVGATLYALLCGAPPFTGSSAVEVLMKTVAGRYESITVRRPDVSLETAALIRSCLHADPAARPDDAAQLLTALRRCREKVRSSEYTTVAAPDLPTGEAFSGLPTMLETPSTSPAASSAPVAPSSRALPVRAGVALLALGVAAVAGIAAFSGDAAPPALRTAKRLGDSGDEAQCVVVVDAEGTRIVSEALGSRVDDAVVADGDVLVGLGRLSGGLNPHTGDILRLERDGHGGLQERWRRNGAEGAELFPSVQGGGPVRVSATQIVHRDVLERPGTEIVVRLTSVAMTNGVAILSADGEILKRMWHSGLADRLLIFDDDPPRIVMTGCANSLETWQDGDETEDRINDDVDHVYDRAVFAIRAENLGGHGPSIRGDWVNDAIAGPGRAPLDWFRRVVPKGHNLTQLKETYPGLPAGAVCLAIDGNYLFIDRETGDVLRNRPGAGARGNPRLEAIPWPRVLLPDPASSERLPPK